MSMNQLKDHQFAFLPDVSLEMHEWVHVRVHYPSNVCLQCGCIQATTSSMERTYGAGLCSLVPASTVNTSLDDRGAEASWSGAPGLENGETTHKTKLLL